MNPPTTAFDLLEKKAQDVLRCLPEDDRTLMQTYHSDAVARAEGRGRLAAPRSTIEGWATSSLGVAVFISFMVGMLAGILLQEAVMRSKSQAHVWEEMAPGLGRRVRADGRVCYRYETETCAGTSQ